MGKNLIKQQKDFLASYMPQSLSEASQLVSSETAEAHGLWCPTTLIPDILSTTSGLTCCLPYLPSPGNYAKHSQVHLFKSGALSPADGKAKCIFALSDEDFCATT